MMTATSTELAPDYRISRLVKGGWQLAGGHGSVDRERAVEDMFAFVEAGITTFDCADIYTGVEELVGEFLCRYRRRYGLAAARRLKIHTKCVPDYDSLATLDKATLQAGIDRSLQRLGQERLDLVQFHWWDYAVPGYVEAAGWLQKLQQAGKIDRLGVTNFDTTRLRELTDAGIKIVSQQVQYSLLDARPERSMVDFCASRAYSERVEIFIPSATGVAHAGSGLGAFSTSTRHIRQLAAMDSFSW